MKLSGAAQCGGEGGSKTPLSQKHRHQWAERRKAAEEQAERETGTPAEQFENWSGPQIHRDVQRCHTVRGEDRDPLRGALRCIHPHACIYEPYREAENCRCQGAGGLLAALSSEPQAFPILGLHDFFLP